MKLGSIYIDNGKIDRDYNMYQAIITKLNDKSVNFFWAHNAHINSTEYHDFNMKYIENKEHKWYCGYYLKQKLKDLYCIILMHDILYYLYCIILMPDILYNLY